MKTLKENKIKMEDCDLCLKEITLDEGYLVFHSKCYHSKVNQMILKIIELKNSNDIRLDMIQYWEEELKKLNKKEI